MYLLYEHLTVLITKNRDPGVWSIDPKNTLCKMGGDDGHKMVIMLGDLTILG